MTKQALIHKMLETLSQLLDNKIEEVFQFADFLLKNMKRIFFKKGLKSLVPILNH